MLTSTYSELSGAPKFSDGGKIISGGKDQQKVDTEYEVPLTILLNHFRFHSTKLDATICTTEECSWTNESKHSSQITRELS
ncbi:UNVERIFIED_CONTAM: hypothetical protein Slati_1033500 [Sesamum latifolium]|uniref:Uncharacterized protein n=1 Tax=Sesamum latifolium TaxID=2727402 RepID=A0AAW2XS79_9LAMI